MRTDPPLVSCIMPTRNRRHLVPQAIAYFLRQDYPRTELIVVDDGDDPVAISCRPTRVLPAPGPAHAAGAKRNLAVQASQGDLIAHWDDDDLARSTGCRSPCARRMPC
jgi:glycosyltransferase involved in cell wall biosynthesis